MGMFPLSHAKVPTVGPNIFATNVTHSTTMRQNVVPQQSPNVFQTNTNTNAQAFGQNVFGTPRVNVQPQPQPQVGLHAE
jgi:hypothetical protein